MNENNRWLRITDLIPWEELESEYARHFSDIGRPATDAQLVIGLLLLKHMTGLSDEGVVEEVLENPYMQAFCGYEKFVTEEILDSSTLTKMREHLGLEFFKELEKKTYKLLIDRKIIKAKGALVHVDGFLFLDHFAHRAFAEEELSDDEISGCHIYKKGIRIFFQQTLIRNIIFAVLF